MGDSQARANACNASIIARDEQMMLGPYSGCLRYYELEADRSSLTTRLLKAPSAQLPTYGDHRALVGGVGGW
jgi:hypothetical protein